MPDDIKADMKKLFKRHRRESRYSVFAAPKKMLKKMYFKGFGAGYAYAKARAESLQLDLDICRADLEAERSTIKHLLSKEG